MLKLRFVPLLGLFLIINSVSAFARPIYALQKRVGERQTVLRVYNRRTGKAIWKGYFRDASGITWSKDHRAFAFVTSTGQSLPFRPTAAMSNYSYSIEIWQAGKQGQLYSKRPYCRYDYAGVVSWSPDKRSLLIMAGGSGESDTGSLALWCINVQTGEGRYISSSVSTPSWAPQKGPRWHGSHDVIYHHQIRLWDKHGESGFRASQKQYHYTVPKR